MQQIFSTQKFIQHRVRAYKGFSGYDFILKIVTNNIKERLLEFENKIFENVLDLGAREGYFKEFTGKSFKNLTEAEFAKEIINFKKDNNGVGQLLLDFENIELEENSYDLIISCLNLHYVNNLPLLLLNVKKALKKNGMFIWVVFGGKTLSELREVFLNYEINHLRGVSPRVIPMIDPRDMAGLMQKAGFNFPVVDNLKLEVEYNNILKLFYDLRGMGETNCLIEGNKNLPKNFVSILNEIYNNSFSNEDGNIFSSFELITATGFKG